MSVQGWPVLGSAGSCHIMSSNLSPCAHIELLTNPICPCSRWAWPFWAGHLLWEPQGCYSMTATGREHRSSETWASPEPGTGSLLTGDAHSRKMHHASSTFSPSTSGGFNPKQILNALSPIFKQPLVNRTLALSATPSCSWNTSRDGSHTSCLGSPPQDWTSLSHQVIPAHVQSELPLAQLDALSSCCLGQEPDPSWLQPPFRKL